MFSEKFLQIVSIHIIIYLLRHISISTIFALFYAIIALHVVDVHIFLFVSEQPLRQKFLNNIPAVFPFPHPPTSALVFSGRNIFKIQQITLQENI